jgi:hypothetical protein
MVVVVALLRDVQIRPSVHQYHPKFEPQWNFRQIVDKEIESW